LETLVLHWRTAASIAAIRPMDSYPGRLLQ
jgi:hypothetical protein